MTENELGVVQDFAEAIKKVTDEHSERTEALCELSEALTQFGRKIFKGIQRNNLRPDLLTAGDIEFLLQTAINESQNQTLDKIQLAYSPESSVKYNYLFLFIKDWVVWVELQLDSGLTKDIATPLEGEPTSSSNSPAEVVFLVKFKKWNQLPPDISRCSEASGSELSNSSLLRDLQKRYNIPIPPHHPQTGHRLGGSDEKLRYALLYWQENLQNENPYPDGSSREEVERKINEMLGSEAVLIHTALLRLLAPDS